MVVLRKKVSVAFLDDFAPDMNNTSEILKDVQLKKVTILGYFKLVSSFYLVLFFYIVS